MHASPGIVRLQREDAASFERRYRLLDNRRIDATRLPADEAREHAVRGAFTDRWLAQERHLANLRMLEDEQRLFAAALAARRGEPDATIDLAGPGYFLGSDERTASGGGVEPGLVALRDAIARGRGTDFLAARRAAIRAELAALPAPATAEPQDDGALFARRRHGIATRYRDLAVRLAAVDILRAATPLRDDALRDTGLRLAAAEQRGLRALGAHLERRALALLDSTRPDAGLALVVTLARLAAVERSRSSGRWLVLDTFPDDAVVVDAARVARHRDAVTAALATNRRTLDEARRALAAASAGAIFPEPELAAVELAANRWLEARRSEDAPRSYRLAPEPFVPARAAALVPVLPWPDTVLERAVATAAAAAERHRARVRARYDYDLLERNCVTELLQTLADAGVGAAPAGLDFIPVAARARVAGGRPAGETRTLPSRREAALAAARTEDGALVVALRESNVVTATAYRRNPDDSLFLFFTDGTPAVRPLLGAVNLGVGLGGAMAGLATWPLDAGRLLAAGARGALFSLPELAFVNIRKGTYDHVPAAGLPDAAVPR